MVFNAGIIGTFMKGAEIATPLDCLIEVVLEYSLPNRSRNAKTKLLLAPFNFIDDAAYNALSTADRKTQYFEADYATKGDQTTDKTLYWSPTGFSNYLQESLVKHMLPMQSCEVRYRKCEIYIYTGLVWDKTKFIAPSNGARQLLKVYRFKSGSACVGKLPPESHVSDKALAYLTYGVEMTDQYDKPSRFLILGTAFRNNLDLLSSPSAQGVENFLGAAFEVNFTGTNKILICPLCETQGYARRIAAVQLEGLSKVAGGTAKESRSTQQNPPA